MLLKIYELDEDFDLRWIRCTLNGVSCKVEHLIMFSPDAEIVMFSSDAEEDEGCIDFQYWEN